ncbi:disulfide bond formation protein B [Alkalilimnicola ehrlichii MLHE-1]|uniref:Disulfide bond formation protein B n=1 Tax=Alkalilimnicola ehrlichii (strain ATCC BAA-1101 / DSM 17681 / MLHE-1) TaxID=187272 RepID=DSBB_ALKEH|nr:disulfide bond formation protein B [Alkalilimnicola ehrlichii]Q0A4N8.1 RecName: Full=Disulfide bond formation protein B; AltName: Full=Disulfide oxidoreductase [Alkalilimnicola ehrlichii MLHE-1]ABI58199.1 Disulfide bond formation protein DsbB [Alkalilimnicola ehrlichii MLHE-1]
MGDWLLRRRGLALLLVLTLLLNLGALGLEYLADMPPCPLCWVQRGVFGLMSLVALVGLVYFPRGWGRWPLAGALGLSALTGVIIALRHLYIQANPDAVSCGMSPEVLAQFLPWWEVLLEILSGTTDCTQVDAVLGVPLPGWTLVGYLALGALGLYAVLARRA